MTLYAIRMHTPVIVPDFFAKMLASREGTDSVISVCAACHSVRDDRSRWQPLGEDILSQVECRVSHSICPKCMRELYPEYVDEFLVKNVSA